MTRHTPQCCLLVATTAVALLVVAACGSSDTGDHGESSPATSRPTSTHSQPAAAAVRPSEGCAANPKGAAAGSAATEPVEQAVVIDGVERTYLLSTAGTQPDQPAPVVVLLHGMGMTAAEENKVTDLPARGGGAGMIVVTPQAVGTPTLWRPGAHSPDAAFLDQILDDVAATHCIDTARIHMAGFSVGAVLAASYACARQDKIASIVTVAVEAPAGCTQPMPILSFHGTADPVIAYGNRDPAAGAVTGTEANMAAWAATAGCAPEPTTKEVGAGAVRLEWPNCADDAEVVLFRIADGGHVWPGADAAPAGVPSAQQVKATDEALAFFARHHR